jgi:flagellar basal-body rod modification protein FlgD
MSTVQGTTATGAITPTAQSTAGALGKDDFLKLLVTQLQHQDPLNPMEDKDFIGQMAQFSSLEQITNLTRSMERMSLSSEMSQAVALIGHEVTYSTGKDTTATGTATAVTMNAGDVKITIGETEVSLDQIRSVS